MLVGKKVRRNDGPAARILLSTGDGKGTARRRRGRCMPSACIGGRASPRMASGPRPSPEESGEGFRRLGSDLGALGKRLPVSFAGVHPSPRKIHQGTGLRPFLRRRSIVPATRRSFVATPLCRHTGGDGGRAPWQQVPADFLGWQPQHNSARFFTDPNYLQRPS